MHVLIIEDEAKTVAFLKKGLTEEGFIVDTALDGRTGLQLALNTSFDIIILDIMIPGIDGWEVLERLRKAGNETPVLYLTALDAVEDRVHGLRLGADDYLVKPFSFAELVARIYTIQRRGSQKIQNKERIGDLEIDFEAHRVTRGGSRIDLTAKEFALLSLFVRRQGEVLSRRRIMEQVWNLDFESDANVVDVHVRRLRAKVDDPYEKKLLHTVRGLGYVFEER